MVNERKLNEYYRICVNRC